MSNPNSSNIRALPGYSKLFSDYLEQVPSVRQFFPCPPTRDSLKSHAAENRGTGYSRREICEALQEQARESRSGARTLENIDRLREPETLVVVTTQAPALFGGTLSRYLQCLTAIKLASALDTHGISAVPICWILSERMDFNDVGSIGVSGDDEEVKELGLEPPVGVGKFPVGTLTLSAQISDLLSSLREYLPDGTEVHDLLASSYAAGVSLATAFGRLLSALMDRWGLILLDPQRPEYQVLTSPLLERFSLPPGELEKVLRRQKRRLAEAGYPGPLSPGYKVRAFGDLQGDGDVGREQREPPDENANSVEVRTDTALIPVIQHSLLPIVADIAGPAELEWFAASMPLFDLFQLQPPVVWPAVSATIVDGRSRKILEKYDRSLEDLFAGPDSVLQAIVQGKLDAQTAERFDSVAEEVETRLTKLAAALPPDPNLGAAVETSRSKILYQLGKLKEKYQAARTLREEAMARQIARLCRTLAPEGQTQERRFGGVEYLLRYSRNFVEQLYDKIDIWRPEHQIIPVD